MSKETTVDNRVVEFRRATPRSDSQAPSISTSGSTHAPAWTIVSTQQAGTVRIRVVTRKTRLGEWTVSDDLC